MATDSRVVRMLEEALAGKALLEAGDVGATAKTAGLDGKCEHSAKGCEVPVDGSRSRLQRQSLAGVFPQFVGSDVTRPCPREHGLEVGYASLRPLKGSWRSSVNLALLEVVSSQVLECYPPLVNRAGVCQPTPEKLESHFPVRGLGRLSLFLAVQGIPNPPHLTTLIESALAAHCLSIICTGSPRTCGTAARGMLPNHATSLRAVSSVGRAPDF